MTAEFDPQSVLRVDARPSAGELAQLSDLSPQEVREFERAWPDVPVARRASILANLRQLAEDNVEYNFKQVFLLALSDPDPDVRAGGVQGLWEEESIPVLERLEHLLASDRTPEVRAAVAEALGRFAYGAAVGRLDQSRADHLEESLRRALISGADGSDLQLRALESLSYYAEQPLVGEFVARLYREGDEEEQGSALIAMGRTMDPRWHDAIREELASTSPRLRFLAAHAAGDAVLTDAVPALLRLVEQDDDLEVRQAAVWALGQIGTEPATRTLRNIAQEPGHPLSEAAEDALDEAVYAADYD